MVAPNLDLLNDSHRFWWHKRFEDSRHEKIIQLVERISRDQDYVRSSQLEHLRSYSKRDYYDDGDMNIVPAGPTAYLGINATKSAVDTIVAKITQQDPHPHFKTEGGDWNLRSKSRKLQKFIDGDFYRCGFFPKARRAFRDSAVLGMGYMKPYFSGGQVRWCRVYPGNVIVDEVSAPNGNAKSMFQIDSVPVESLMSTFPKLESEIAASSLKYRMTNTGAVTSCVRVYEAWHLADDSGKNGRHTICIDGLTLLDEDYDSCDEPLIALPWSAPLVGYYGHGAVEDVSPLQEEMDYIMQRIQHSTHNCANVWLMKPSTTGIPNAHLINKIATIVEYDGPEAPQFYHSQIMHQQVFDHVRWLNELIYNVTGVSAMSATSQKPKGIESGKALQTMLDVESQRFAEVQKNYEDFVVRCVKAHLRLARRHFVGGKSDYEVKVDNGKFTETIKWSDVNLSEEEYVLKVWPTNMLPNTPAGKMEVVERMMQAGLIDSLTGMMLLDFPDVEAQQNLIFSAVRQALWIVDQVIYEGADIEPKEWYDLQRCVKYMQMGMANAEMEGAPPEVMERGLEFIAKCEELLAPPMPPPGAMATPMGGPPMDPNMPPPDLAGMGLPPPNAAMMPPPGIPPQGA